MKKNVTIFYGKGLISINEEGHSLFCTRENIVCWINNKMQEFKCWELA